MGMPKDIKIIDCMLGIPDAEDRSAWFDPFRPLIKDQQTLQQFAMPAQYMFKDIPQTGKVDDFVSWTVEQMDQYGIDKALVGWSDNATSYRAKEMYGDRFFFDLPCDPNKGMEEVRRIKRIHAEVGLSAISVFPAARCRRWRSIINICSRSIRLPPNWGYPCCSMPVFRGRVFRWKHRRSSIWMRSAGSSLT